MNNYMNFINWNIQNSIDSNNIIKFDDHNFTETEKNNKIESFFNLIVHEYHATNFINKMKKGLKTRKTSKIHKTRKEHKHNLNTLRMSIGEIKHIK